jgi:hypothetical protein
MKRKDFWIYLLTVTIYASLIISLIIVINVTVDAASAIKPQHTELAKLALAGNVVATPENYNERVFQECIVNEMDSIPATVVIGSSRGMFLGENVTGYENIYNNCVPGACLEDYYALLGLYNEKFGKMPERVIIETSPWIFYDGNPESRWLEAGTYNESACEFFEIVNGQEITVGENADKENPYISLSYFRYNIDEWKEKGKEVFKEDARISTDVNEAADYPDGTIRYSAERENESPERLEGVKATKGACSYQNSDQMTEIDADKAKAFENLIDYLQDNGTEVLIYMQPFSVTQCIYSIDENLNPGYMIAYSYLQEISQKKNIIIRGSYDARDFELDDNRFIDYMHLDKKGTSIVWNY